MPTAPAWTTAPMSPKEQAERKANKGYTLVEADEIAMDPAKWARIHGKIPERVSKQPVPFEPSCLQGRMFTHYRGCQEREAPCRMVVVKIRRGGGSTGAAALLYLHAHNYSARLGGIGTDETVSMNLFEMMRFFNKHDDFPLWKRASKTLETGKIWWPNGSSWEHFTAENPEAARSAGLQGYHSTETGRYQDGGAKDAKETLRSMLGSVPRRGFTVVIEESTACGATGAFADRFRRGRWPTAEELDCREGREYWRIWEDETPQNVAVDEAEKAMQFVRVFAGWYEDDENRPEAGLSPEGVARIKLTRDEAENRLIARYRTIGPQGERLGHSAIRATLWEQLAWRRATIAIEFEGDVDAFNQENPSSPAEAFASSGRHSFNRAGCAWMLEQAKGRHPQYGVLTRQESGAAVFAPCDKADAWMQVWEIPREGYWYSGALDTCGGRSNVKNADAADYNAGIIGRRAHVAEGGRRVPHTVVAALLHKNQFDPDVLAEKMAMLCDWYGRCLLCFEVNNTGAAFRQEAMRLKMNLYMEETTDAHTSETTGTVGWTTSARTRPLLISTLKKHIRNNANSETRAEGVDCPVLFVAEECSEMVRWPDGKDAAPGGKHDDGALALAMWLQTISGATFYAPKKRKRQDPPDLKSWRMR